MTTTTASLLALALAFAGMAALSAAMDRHYEQLTRRRETPRQLRLWLRGAGSLSIVGALAPCVLVWGGSVGTVVWLGFLSAGALCVVVLLLAVASRPVRGWRRLAVVVSAIAMAGGALWWWQARPSVAYQTQAVARGDVASTVTAIGTLQPRSYVDVGAQVSGLIQRLPVAPGSVVKKGQLLVEIDPSVQQATVDAGRAALAGLRAQRTDQQAQHRLAVQQLARQQQMAADGATRSEDLQTAEATLASTAAKVAHLDAQIAQTQATQRAEEARLGYTRIFAPMAGTVVSVEAREGQTLNATYQTPNILRIADLSAMTVWTEVSEADVRRVKAGLPVYFTTLGGLDGIGGAAQRRWTARVRQVLPAPPVPEGQAGGKASGGSVPGAAKAVVYTVLFDVDNADGELMPQMTAQVGFVTAQAQGVIAVPLAALTAVEGEQGAYTARVLDPDGQPVVRPVRVGLRSRHQAEVQQGLAEGDRLVVGEKPVEGVRWIQW